MSVQFEVRDKLSLWIVIICIVIKKLIYWECCKIVVLEKKCPFFFYLKEIHRAEGQMFDHQYHLTQEASFKEQQRQPPL